MPTITVAGSATKHLPAERGTVRLVVGFTGERRDSVIALTTKTHSALVAQAREHVAQGAATWWGADQVSAWPYDDWVKPRANKDGKKVRRFRASAAVRVKFSDFAALSTWVAEVAALEGVSIGGIDWALTDVRRDAAHAEVRAAAAKDVVARAQAYADALELGSVQLVALCEEGLRPQVAGAGVAPVGYTARSAAAPGGGGGAIELQPDDIEVTVRLSADFETAAD